MNGSNGQRRQTRPGRPRGREQNTGDGMGSIRADELLPLRELCRRLGIGSRGWRTLRDSGVPVRRVGKQAFVLGDELLAHFRRLPIDQGGPDA